MKKITLLFAMLLFSVVCSSQSIVIGTGADLTDGTGSDPIDGYYNSFKYQVVYTEAELSASLTPYDEITGLGFSVSEDYAGGNLQGYEIKMGHTSAANSVAHDVSSTSTVKNAFDYDPSATAAGVFDMISFDSNFVWNGIDNVLVEICSAGQNAFSSPYGGVRVTTIVDGSRHNRVDGSSACGNNTNNANGNKPNIQFDYIDGTPPACLSPNTLTASAITATGANLGWTTGGSGEADWEIVVQAAGTGAPAGSGVSTAGANPYIAGSLTSATNYEFYVRADCGGSFSTWSGPFLFTTPCSTFSAPYIESFENTGVIPSCWTMSGGENWGFDTTGAGNHIGNNGTISGATISGGYFAWIDDSGSEAPSILTSPLVDVSGLTTPGLFFYELSNNEGDANATLDVEVWDGAAWNNVGTYNTNSTGWEQKFVDISGLTITGDVQVRFTITDSGSFYDDIAIDDVEFKEAPTCIAPNTLTASAITATGANLGWTTGGSGEANWEIVVQTAGTGAPAGSGVSTAGANPYISGSLTAATDYEFYVRADCGGSGFSAWVGPFTFTTLCATITPAYTNDFTTYPANCWEEGDDTDIATGPNNTNGNWAGTDYLNTPATSKGAKLNMYLSGDMDWIVSPTFDLSAGSYGMAVDVGVTDYNSAADDTMGSDDEVQVLISNDNGATWIMLETFNAGNEPLFTGESKVYDLAAYTSTTTKFAFWASEGATSDPEDYDFHISNFRVDLYATLGVEELKQIEGFVMYPNPVENELTVSAKSEIKTLSIVNMLGQTVRTVTPNSRNYQLNLSDLTSGIYFVKATVNNTEGTFRIVKK